MESKKEKLVARLRGKDKIKVLFVCLGNICRSPAAEGVLRSIVHENGMDARWEIDSAGTSRYHIGDLPDNRMRVHARRRGYELNHRCRQVQPYDFDDFDIIVPMDASNEANLKRIAPSLEAEGKIVPMIEWVNAATRHDCIPDPYYDGAEGFETVLDLLEDGCANMFNEMN